MRSLLASFLTPWGLIVLGALDSSLIFFLPLGIDVAVVLLSARQPKLFWLFAILAAAGSLIGASLTFWIGRKVGEHGLGRLISPPRLQRVQARVSQGAAISTAILALIPPPFPLTAFVLTSGALRANPWSFLLALTGARVVRFGIEAALAARYGASILRWMESRVFEVVIGALIGLAIVGTIVSAIAVIRSTRRPPAHRKSAA